MENNEIFNIPTRISQRLAIADWHKTMSSYIKNDLYHKRHLLTANYTGQAPMKGYDDSENPCESAYFDDSWQHVDIDVVSWNNYGAGINRYKEMAVDQYEKIHCQEVSDGNYYEFMVKPVLYGENGHLPYLDCDYTGFIKDLMATAFSGTATAGMSWDESKNRDHWFWMGKFRNFIEPEFLYSTGVNLNAESWVPERAVTINDEKFETVYLSKVSDEQKLIGVILNRSWNWHTIGEGLPCSNYPNEDLLPSELINFPTNYSPFGNTFPIKGMGGERRYRIQYYDPISTEVIESFNQYSNITGKLELSAFPLFENIRPFIFFKVWRNPIFSDEQSFFPAIETTLNEQIDRPLSYSDYEQLVIDDGIITTSVLDGAQPFAYIGLYPNPALGAITIDFLNENDYSIQIKDVLGKEVYACNGRGIKINIDLRFLCSGQYLIQINGIHTRKFIKL